MKKSSGNIFSVYAFILSVIILIPYIIMLIRVNDFNDKFVVVWIISSAFTIITSIISIIGLIYANRYWKIFATLALIMNIFFIICIVYICCNACEFV